MPYELRDRVISLAGLMQALKLVQQVARQGLTDQSHLETSIRSLFIMDAEATEDVYGNTANLRLGFDTLIAQLGGSSQTSNEGKRFDSELTRYFVNVVILERKISASREKLNLLTDNLEQAKQQVDVYSYTHDNVLARLADIYVSCISRLNPRIMVNGEHHHLSNNNNANKIRALLFAAIRSAVLWRQTGGKRWQLLFQRAAYIAEAEKLR